MKQTGLDQYAIKKFAEALEVIPRILSETSGQDAEKVHGVLRLLQQFGCTRSSLPCIVVA